MVDKIFKKHLSKKYKQKFFEMREIVNGFDPMGLVSGGAPADEHDNLTTKLLTLLNNDNLNDVRSLLIGCYEWYGSNPNDIKEEYIESFNKKIDRTYKQIEEWYIKNKQ